ncbi:MAG TPA: universal stress protein [Flavisolibacter sp.]
MKKFIAAFDGLKFSESTQEYAIYAAKNCNAHLVGVFLEDFTRHRYSIAEVSTYNGADFDEHLKDLNHQEQEERDRAVSLFEEACTRNGVTFTIHRDKNIALQELLHESIYSDLLIIDASETLSRYSEKAPTRFIRELLDDVQCPVLLVPPKFKPLQAVTLLYDGEPSSVFAVKMFSYVFDTLSVEQEVISVKSQEESLHLPDNRLMKEFMKRHFPNAEYIVLKGLVEDEIIRYLQHHKKESLVVLGAYRRGRISRIFRPSMADTLLRHLKVPLFIAHNKS